MNQQACLSFENDFDYPAGFWHWFHTVDGQCVWLEFEKRALQMAVVRDNYSAQSIVEVIRWNTHLNDGTEFKINNNWNAGLARYWLHKHGKSYPKFFRIRNSQGLDQ